MSILPPNSTKKNPAKQGFFISVKTFFLATISTTFNTGFVIMLKSYLTRLVFHNFQGLLLVSFGYNNIIDTLTEVG